MSTILRLRDYQEPIVKSVVAAYDRGVTRQLLACPTGSGKTIVASHLVRTFSQGMRWRVIFMVHRDELVKQTQDKLALVVPEKSVGVVKAERNELDKDIIVVSAQTVANQKRLDRLVASLREDDAPVLFISDEAHHDRAQSRMRVIETVNPELLIGLTATPERGDGLGLGLIYQEITHHISLISMIAANRLSKLVGMRISTETDLDSVHTRGGEFVEKELDEKVNTPERNRLIVRAYKEKCHGRKKTVAFCVTVSHAENLRDEFRRNNIPAEMVLGSTPTDDRVSILKRFSQGDIPVLVNVLVLTEGYDEPGIDCVLMARPTKSKPLYVQIVGRAARTAPGKDDALILDFVDVARRHKLITLPKLAGKEENETGALSKNQKEEEDEDDLAGEEDRADGQLFDLAAFTLQEIKDRKFQSQFVDLFGASPHIWKLIDGMSMAIARPGAWLVLKPGLKASGEDQLYTPYLVENYRDENNHTRTRVTSLFPRPTDYEVAMSIAEEHISPDNITLREADWRSPRRKPSPNQLAYAQRLGLDTTGKSRSQVSDLIEEKMFGIAIRRAGLITKPTVEGQCSCCGNRMSIRVSSTGELHSTSRDKSTMTCESCRLRCRNSNKGCRLTGALVHA